MSPTAVRCPHCGAFQAAKKKDAPAAPPVAKKNEAYREPARPAEPAKPRTPIRDVTSDEARALVTVAAVKDGFDVEGPDDEPGIVEGLVLPHPRTEGVGRWADIALTVVALPLVLASALALALLSLRAARFGGVRGRPVWFRILGVCVGTGLLLSLVSRWTVEPTLLLAILGSQLGALVVRGALRSAAKAKRRAAFDLTR
ncbi:hypothetical protein [Sandaracinus amylolyticus]|uniref:hypothetical protein n=1 Tax=Sandaracinus amylolyticus TaxID=927083 RepID=UPI001F1CB877|nr:hypothetical protein [Sandaracinus amylolyticus]UJR87070.1 Hypothetical protein I5071_91710 [Sandaracinus amylolyticus]